MHRAGIGTLIDPSCALDPSHSPKTDNADPRLDQDQDKKQEQGQDSAGLGCLKVKKGLPSELPHSSGSHLISREEDEVDMPRSSRFSDAPVRVDIDDDGYLTFPGFEDLLSVGYGEGCDGLQDTPSSTSNSMSTFTRTSNSSFTTWDDMIQDMFARGHGWSKGSFSLLMDVERRPVHPLDAPLATQGGQGESDNFKSLPRVFESGDTGINNNSDTNNDNLQAALVNRFKTPVQSPLLLRYMQIPEVEFPLSERLQLQQQESSGTDCAHNQVQEQDQAEARRDSGYAPSLAAGGQSRRESQTQRQQLAELDGETMISLLERHQALKDRRSKIQCWVGGDEEEEVEEEGRDGGDEGEQDEDVQDERQHVLPWVSCKTVRTDFDILAFTVEYNAATRVRDAAEAEGLSKLDSLNTQLPLLATTNTHRQKEVEPMPKVRSAYTLGHRRRNGDRLPDGYVVSSLTQSTEGDDGSGAVASDSDYVAISSSAFDNKETGDFLGSFINYFDTEDDDHAEHVNITNGHNSVGVLMKYQDYTQHCLFHTHPHLHALYPPQIPDSIRMPKRIPFILDEPLHDTTSAAASILPASAWTIQVGPHYTRVVNNTVHVTCETCLRQFLLTSKEPDLLERHQEEFCRTRGQKIWQRLLLVIEKWSRYGRTGRRHWMRVERRVRGVLYWVLSLTINWGMDVLMELLMLVQGLSDIDDAEDKEDEEVYDAGDHGEFGEIIPREVKEMLHTSMSWQGLFQSQLPPQLRAPQEYGSGEDVLFDALESADDEDKAYEDGLDEVDLYRWL
ncbi:MAG: hypothetical protein J3R72DRAFT_491359 [Linnemannia gamsii]|nr:MAG: hypothetical protein J3R72DRAFT_491359 [Linnemannia gamsii]